MELNFKSLEEYIQAYMDGALPMYEAYNAETKKKECRTISLTNDLNKASNSQRMSFVEKYMEFVSPKQLRRGTSTASDDKDFRLVEVWK